MPGCVVIYRDHLPWLSHQSGSTFLTSHQLPITLGMGHEWAFPAPCWNSWQVWSWTSLVQVTTEAVRSFVQQRPASHIMSRGQHLTAILSILSSCSLSDPLSLCPGGGGWTNIKITRHSSGDDHARGQSERSTCLFTNFSYSQLHWKPFRDTDQVSQR